MKKRATHKVDLDASIMRQLDFSSTVVVEVLVDATGDVVCVKSISGISFALEPVEKALQAWKFETAKSLWDGKPVAYLGQLEFPLCKGVCPKQGFGVTLLK